MTNLSPVTLDSDETNLQAVKGSKGRLIYARKYTGWSTLV